MLSTLQAGRACAALAVAAFHLSLMMGVERYGGVQVFRDWTSRGDLGVEFFFVLSGFVILMAHYDDIGQPHKVTTYVWKRAIRVYPIYLIYTLVFTALVLLGIGNNTPLPQTASGWLSALTLIRFTVEPPPIGPAWTLFHEVAFYALFTGLILGKRIGAAVLVLWLAVCLWTYHPPQEDTTPFAVYFSSFSFHFCLGMLAYLVFRRSRDAWPMAMAVGGCGVAILGVATVMAKDAGHVPLLAWSAGFAGLLVLLTSMEARYGIKAPRWLRYIGDASYSIYLLHIALMGLLLKLLALAGITQRLPGELVFAIVIAGATILGCLAYALIEAPLLRALRKIGPGTRDEAAKPGHAVGATA